MARTGTRKVPVEITVSGPVSLIRPFGPAPGKPQFTRIAAWSPEINCVMVFPAEQVAKVRVGDQMTVHCRFQTTGNGRTGRESDGRS
jgi:hypothetical protein